ncbi:type I DNA topoisomerase [Cytophagaceae bacterium DM2B3-1]|uniref:DNA topoisomerase 1 n=1 Tax=Xanthocytophaga flava TaxID=3048013 RepID=A0ABT7CVP3_9BACT|nr:type I DNA topoisomerase [Xanthocytophaga flavus]MDJ1497586.1 type I DNA topoisomerase [Xanthocytophaga flavus]
MKLLIVESPNKIKKIKAILGSGWEVAASVGHIRDLPAKELSIEKNNNYKMLYQINPDKKQVVSNLKKLVNDIGKDNIYLATDPDREGEAISFHLCIALGLDYKTTHRVTFQEITQKAIIQALAKPRQIDLRLVAAQEGRRAIDRLVGYEVSPLLWKKLEKGLSAGRVQSVALRLCVERERVIESFKDKFSFGVHGWFITTKEDKLKAKRMQSFQTEKEAETYLKSISASKFQVVSVQKQEVKQEPLPSFSTSSLQQDGVKKLKWNVKKVMDVAQKLFESGHITYMRTDSVNLSEDSINEAQVQIEANYGTAYFKKRTYKSKASAQEAHEAIRPTHFDALTAGDSEDEQALYRLIYTRAIASQMEAAKFEQTIIQIDQYPYREDIYQSSAKVLLFDGFLKVYKPEEDEDDDETQIKPVKENEKLKANKIEAKQTFVQPPKRFDQATLVGELEKKEIGRPSTYASILNTIMKREYVQNQTIHGKKVNAILLTLQNGTITKGQKSETIGTDKNKLQPTDKGNKVTEFLESNFEEIVDYTFTANCEQNLDEIVEGKSSFLKVVSHLDTKLANLLEKANIHNPDVERQTKQSSQVEIGTYKDKPIKAGSGKYGPYLLYDKIFYSLEDKKKDFSSISLNEAISLIEKGKKPSSTSDKYQPKDDPNLIKTVGAYQIKRKKDDPTKFYVTKEEEFAMLKITLEQIDLLTEKECKEAISSFKKWQKQNSKSSSRIK